jgi:aryl-alcohol dehydrogenase-like predicted oxidoreductase
VTVQQIALAALLAASPVMLPIPGTGSLAHLAENIGAATVRLSPEDIAGLAART